MTIQNNNLFTKHEIIFELKTLLKEVIPAKDIDVTILASKLLSYIYKEEHIELKDFFESKLSEYYKLKYENIEQYRHEEQELYNQISLLALKLNPNAVLDKYVEAQKIFTNALDFEYKCCITEILQHLPDKLVEEINTKSIYKGVFSYSNIINTVGYKYLNGEIAKLDSKTKIYNIDLRAYNKPLLLTYKIEHLYEYYYLYEKSQYKINNDNKSISEWIYLKISIIKIINDLITNITKNNNNIDKNKNNLSGAHCEILKFIMEKELYNNIEITTAEKLITEIYENETNLKYRSVLITEINKHFKHLLPDYMKNIRKPVPKIFYIAKILNKKEAIQKNT